MPVAAAHTTNPQEGLFEPPATAAVEHFLDERQRLVDPIRRELERLQNVERRRAQAQQERERLHAAGERLITAHVFLLLRTSPVRSEPRMCPLQKRLPDLCQSLAVHTDVGLQIRIMYASVLISPK